MATEKREGLKVEVPGSKADTVQFARVGIIALVGFAAGIAWPRLAGIRLVPSVPVPAVAEASARELSGAPAEVPKPSEAPPVAPPAAPSSERSPMDRVVLSDFQVVSCRDARGKRIESCDRVDFDRVAREPLRELGACEGTRAASGVLSLGFELDFAKQLIKGIHSGKSTSLPQAEIDRFLGCARQRFQNISLIGIPHEHSAYTLYYRLELSALSASGTESEPAGSELEQSVITPASGTATVTWDVALVRASPARDGQVLARLLSGTRLNVTGKSGDWFRVRFDAKGNQGWVFRTAIGM